MDKLLVTDIDGTITHTAHSLDPKVIKALENMHELGWKICFITGRFFAYAQPLLKELAVPYLLGCQNGVSLWSSELQQFVYSFSIPSDLITRIEKGIGDLPVIFFIEAGASYQDRLYRCSSHIETELRTMLDRVYFPTAESRARLVDASSISDIYPHPDFAVAKCFGPADVIKQLSYKLAEQKELMDYFSMKVMRWPFDFRLGILFLIQKHVSKGAAIDEAVQRFCGGKPFIMASGDDVNDIELLEKGDFKIVMQTAPEHMHAMADFLAPSAKDLGILEAWSAGNQAYNNLTRL